MSGFRATGQGFANNLPNFPADSSNASAVMTDTVSGKRIYLFVTSVGTSWSLRGSSAQTQSRKTFYPQHVVQNNVIVKGQVSNQYEYDRIVEFAEQHHHNMLGISARSSGVFGGGLSSSLFGSSESGADQNDGGIGVRLMLLPASEDGRWIEPPSNSNTDFYNDPSTRSFANNVGRGIYRLPKFHVSGLITEIRSGARFGDFAPEFELGLKVTRDYLGPLYADKRDVDAAVKLYGSALGSMYKPETVTDGSNSPVDGDSFVDNLGDYMVDTLSYWNTLLEEGD